MVNVFDLRTRLIKDYSEFVSSFVSIKDPQIAELVDDELREGLLWREPQIQLNPLFEYGESIDEACEWQG